MSTRSLVRDEGVAGSNPATPTTLPEVPGPSPDSFPDRNSACGTAPYDKGAHSRGKGAGIKFLRDHVNDPDGPCLIWPLSCDNHGYAICGLNGKRFKAARLMCEMVNGPPPTPKHHTAHSCGKGQEACVHPKHVRWATPKENMADSVRLGAVRQPGRPAEILNEEKVAQILAMRGKASYSVIGPMFGVKPKQIGKIFRGEQWKGGKLGRRGFAPGDPRNSGPRALRPRAVV